MTKQELKSKAMLGLIWVGVLALTGMAGDGAKSLLDWLTWAIHIGLLGGLAVALRHYYRQIKANAIFQYRFILMWNDYRKKHDLSNGGEDDHGL